jgi:steroid 5-alpha reductase family enzyme
LIDLQNIILEVGMVIGLYMTIIFILALIRKDNSIVDIAWGVGFIIIAVYSIIQSGEIDLRKMIVSLLVLLWGLRLSFHIMVRNSGKGEDFRYKAWRDTWKLFFLRSFFQIFMLQGLFMLIISTPIWFISFSSGGPIGMWDSIGLFIFGFGFMFEVIGDYQLTEFRKDPLNKGKIMTTGLWSITRHPNYFGEALVWLGISFYALSFPNGWYTLISPLIITLLLRFVSGVPMLEKKYQNHPDWQEYKANTAAFVPFVKFL